MTMNKKWFWFALFTYGFLFAQSIIAGGLYDDGFSGSQNSLQVFRNRFNEIKNDIEFANITRGDGMPGAYSYFGSYAGSQNSLQVFRNRFNEIKSDIEFANITRGDGMPQAYYFY